MALDRTGARQRWLTLHLYLALILGFFFAVLGLTGSLSMLGEGLDGLLNPRLSVEPLPGSKPSLDDLMAAVRLEHPDYKGPWTLELPRTPDDPLTAWFEKPLETRGQAYAPLMVSVNPYSGQVLASRFWGQTARTWLLDLHSHLHLGRFGARWVGLMGVALILSVLSGLYLWWPGLTRVRSAFRLRHEAGMNLFLFDLHRLIGLAGFIALLILAFTGFNLAYPALGEALVGTSGMSHDADGPAIRSTGKAPANHPVTLEEVVLLARGPFPRAEVRQITTPEGPEGTYRVTFRQAFEVNQRHPMTAVWVDQYSGQIRQVRNAARFSRGETLITTIWPLHTGEMLGGWGRLAWFLAGLMLPVLYVSGMVRWLIGRGSISDRTLDFTVFNRWARTLSDGAILCWLQLERGWRKFKRQFEDWIAKW
jgi:uncharacterized iron-regulated membrane protein